jgi:hypothetical protein
VTGLDAWDEISAKIVAEGGAPPTPERFMRLVNNVMRDINSYTPVYWRRRKLVTQANQRFLALGEPVLGVIKGATTNPSTHQKKELTTKPSMAFAGPGDDTTADGRPAWPNCIWTENDMQLQVVYVCFDPRPDRAYPCHLTLHYRVPEYVSPVLPLPVHELVHPVVVEGVLSALTEGDDFHNKSYHVEHLQLFMAGKDMARELVRRPARARKDVADEFHARSRTQDESY